MRARVEGAKHDIGCVTDQWAVAKEANQEEGNAHRGIQVAKCADMGEAEWSVKEVVWTWEGGTKATASARRMV